ncbi:phosphotransferase family protein [Streptacidiphilus sp. EB103A]|uniref:phosphotransferase family protein n=1 Tax=Streptacidiphilus sp. EB103A TaxID=3156275 RepID=UPI003518AC22
MQSRTNCWKRHEGRSNREERGMRESGTATGGGNQHPVLARLADDIDRTRQAAESALAVVFDAGAIVGYGGRSVVFLARDSVLKIYTHRPAERARREIAGLSAAGHAGGLRIPQVLGSECIEGALAWVVSTALEGSAPGHVQDAAETRMLGQVAARLHAMPTTALAGLEPFRRNIRAIDRDPHPQRAQLSAVLVGLEVEQLTRCDVCFVDGDLSSRNLLIAPGLPPAVVDFEGCGLGCGYEDLTNLYVQDCLIGGRDAAVALAGYREERQLLGSGGPIDARHLLFHTARYFRWVLQWAPEIDAELAQQVCVLTPRVLDALSAEGPVPL